MPNQTIPITLTWGPVSASFTAADINELGTLLAKQLAGSIRADVSFILPTLNDPTTFTTQLIFNTTQGVFKSWSTTSGKYVPVTDSQIGDVKNTFVGVDTLATGWVILNGRSIAAIPGLSLQQQTVLETFFGVGGSLPTVIPQNIAGLPVVGSFSGIVTPAVLPAAGIIGALPIGATYDQGEVTTLRDDTEILRTSTAAVETQAAAIQAKAEQLLVAISNNTTPPLYSSLFIGFS